MEISILTYCLRIITMKYWTTYHHMIVTILQKRLKMKITIRGQDLVGGAATLDPPDGGGGATVIWYEHLQTWMAADTRE